MPTEKIQLLARLLPVLLLKLLLASPLGAADAPGPPVAYKDSILPLLQRYCGDCHSDETQRGPFQFEGFSGRIDTEGVAADWHEVVNVLNEGRMPPPDADQPSPEERLRIVAWTAAELRRAEMALAGSGTTVLRRLNRREYEATIESLLGVTPVGSTLFAKDGTIEGLDNQGQGLFMSGYQLEQFLDTATATLEAAIDDGTWPRLSMRLEGEAMKYDPHAFVFAHAYPDPHSDYRRQLERYESLSPEQKAQELPPQKLTGREIEGLAWAHEHDPPTRLVPGRGIVVHSPITVRAQLIIAGAKLIVPLEIPKDGWYRIRISAGAGPETPWDRSTLTIGLYELVGGKGGAQNMGHNPVLREEVKGTLEAPETIEQLAFFRKGQRSYYLHKGNLGWETEVYEQTDMYRMLHQERVPRSVYWRGLLVDAFEIEGPVPADKAHDLLFPDGLEPPYSRDKALTAVTRLAAKAFRRPVTPAEMEPYLRFHSDLDRTSFVEGVKRGAAMILSSPKFIYLAESSTHDRQLSPRELAIRLAYFLWNEGPDEQLLSLASSGALADRETIRGQTRRLLDDPRSSRFIRSFTTGWLGLDRLDTVIPDRRRFPRYTFDMPDTLREQTVAFVEEILRGNRSGLDIIDSDWDMLNAKLARYYGLDHLEIKGTHLRPVTLDDASRPQRGGILGHASVLTMTSNGTRTSPIVRGAWIAERLLGDPPPPPPPSVSALEGSNAETDVESLTIKQLVALHQQDPACAACHRRFDPYGMAFENYDPVGHWRDHAIRFVSPDRFNRPYRHEPIAPIDPTGILPEGRAFDGPIDMKRILLERRGEFASCLTAKLLAYALGRPVTFSDGPVVRELTETFMACGFRFAPLIEAITTHPCFHTK